MIKGKRQKKTEMRQIKRWSYYTDTGRSFKKGKDKDGEGGGKRERMEKGKG
jgi:hypothetical protein